MKRVVKYHNDLNTILMRKWTSEEMNFFFAIIAKAKEKGTQTLIFDTNELKEFTHFSTKHNMRWEDTMASVTKKITQLTYWERTEEEIRAMTLFKEFSVNFKTRTATVEVSDKFEYILNKLQAQFTVWELEEFTQLRSTYAKTMYRLLKQWRSQGKKEFSKEDLFTLLDVPKSVQSTGNFTNRVLTPIKGELTLIFESFKINAIKGNSRGNPVIAYEFLWKAEKTKKIKEIDNSQEENQIDYDANEMLETFKKVTGL